MLRNLARVMTGLAAVLVATTVLSAQSSINTFQLKRPDGDPVRALVAGPEDADAAILLLHDWFGATDATWEVLESFFARNLRE